MNKLTKLVSFVLVLTLAAGILAGCQQADATDPTTTAAALEVVDYVSNLKLDMNSDTLKLEVTVKTYVDGDTTHFYVPTELVADGVLKARYLCVNTPESTGKIEPWGKTASNFTKEKLSTAKSIIIESSDSELHVDSTGSRYLMWVWYQPAEGGDYRLLNLELIQNGLSITGGSVSELYGDITTQAFQQAKQQKLCCFSGQEDPNFYYGTAYEVDLKGLRSNIALYDGVMVAFEGVVTRFYSDVAYLECYDSETDMYYGISVYCGSQVTGDLLLTMTGIGNLVRVVGTVTSYEGSWQVSGISYNAFKPEKPENTQLISSGHAAGNRLTTAETFCNGKVEAELFESLDSEEGTIQEVDYAAMAIGTSIAMENLLVTEIYTTNNGGKNDGAMTLTCQVDGLTVTVRTAVLKDEAGNVLTAADFQDKTIDVVGIVDYYNGEYQIEVFKAADITVHE